jgi:hypothetical protein
VLDHCYADGLAEKPMVMAGATMVHCFRCRALWWCHQEHRPTWCCAVTDPHAQYVVLNGSQGALTEKTPLVADQGDRIRIFFGNAGGRGRGGRHVCGHLCSGRSYMCDTSVLTMVHCMSRAGPNLSSSFHVIGTIFDKVRGGHAEPVCFLMADICPS